MWNGTTATVLPVERNGLRTNEMMLFSHGGQTSQKYTVCMNTKASDGIQRKNLS